MTADQVGSGAAVPHVEITRQGEVLFSTLTAGVSRVEAAAERAREITATIARLEAIGRTNLTPAQTDLLSQLTAQLGQLPDPNETRSGVKRIFLADLDYSENGVRRSCTFVLRNAASLVPIGLDDTASPLADTEVKVFWDVADVRTVFDAARLPSEIAAAGRLGVGTYRIDSTSLALERDGSVSLTIVARDGLQRLSDIALPENVSVAAGTNPVTEIVNRIRRHDPNADIVSASTDATVGPLSWEQGTSERDVIEDLSRAADLVTFVNRDGVYRVEQRADPSDDAFAESGFAGFTTSNIVTAARDIRRNGIINGVIVRGENMTSGGAPVEAAAWIETGAFAYNADGDGGIGPMPLVIVDRTITDERRARQLANSELAAKGGVPESVTVEILADPSLKTGDVIRLNVPEIGATGEFTIARTSFSQRDGQRTTILTMEERRGGL